MDSSSLQFNLPPISVDITEIRKQKTKRSHTFDKKILRVLSIISVPHQKYPKSFSCTGLLGGYPLQHTTHNRTQHTAHAQRTTHSKKEETKDWKIGFGNFRTKRVSATLILCIEQANLRFAAVVMNFRAFNLKRLNLLYLVHQTRNPCQPSLREEIIFSNPLFRTLPSCELFRTT
jgi:hypothetical protein